MIRLLLIAASILSFPLTASAVVRVIDTQSNGAVLQSVLLETVSSLEKREITFFGGAAITTVGQLNSLALLGCRITSAAIDTDYISSSRQKMKTVTLHFTSCNGGDIRTTFDITKARNFIFSN